MKVKTKDVQGSYTVAVNAKNTEPITISSLEKIWKEARIIPYKFKPTSEIVYFTPEISYLMEKEKEKIEQSRNY